MLSIWIMASIMRFLPSFFLHSIYYPQFCPSDFSHSLLSLYLAWWASSAIAQSCPTFWDPMDCGLSGSSFHGIFQARVLEWIAISFSRGSSWPRNRTRVSHIAVRCFTIWATRPLMQKDSEFFLPFHLFTPWSPWYYLHQEYQVTQFIFFPAYFA